MHGNIIIKLVYAYISCLDANRLVLPQGWQSHFTRKPSLILNWKWCGRKLPWSIVRQLPKDIAWRNLHFGHRYLSWDLKPKHTVAQSGSTTFKANIHFYGQRTLPLFGKFKQISILAFMAAVVLSLQRCCHVVTQMAASQSQSEGRET
jgi:hypothetical protein